MTKTYLKFDVGDGGSNFCASGGGGSADVGPKPSFGNTAHPEPKSVPSKEDAAKMGVCRAPFANTGKLPNFLQTAGSKLGRSFSLLLGVSLLMMTTVSASDSASGQASEATLTQLIERMDQQASEIARLQAELEQQRTKLAALRKGEDRFSQMPPPPASPMQAQAGRAPSADEPLALPPTPASMAAASNLNPLTSKYSVRFYGYVKLDGFYDSDRVQGGNLSFYVPPEHSDDDGGFGFTANQTRLGLAIGGPNNEYGESSALVEMDFYGAGGAQNKANLRMRRAYVDHRYGDWSFRLGQEWDTLILVQPVSVDFDYMGSRGKLGFRRPQARVTHTADFGESGAFVSSLAIARTMGGDLDGNGVDDGSASEVPTVQAAFAWQPVLFGHSSLVGLSGHWGTEEVGSGAGAAAGDYDTWSVIGSVQLLLWKNLTWRGSLWTGANLDAYDGGVRQGINAALAREISSKGGWTQLSWAPADHWSLNASYGFDDPDDEDLSIGNRSKNESVGGSFFYSPIPAIKLGLEYTHLATDYLGGSEATNNRIQATTIYKF